MKRFVPIVIGFILWSGSLQAARLRYDSTSVNQAAEARLSASFTKHFKRGVTLGFAEEVRLQIFRQESKRATGTSQTAYVIQPEPEYLRRAYTTVSLGYKPVEYIGFNAAYTLMLYGNKGWTDYREFLRHRAAVAVTGQYKYLGWKFALRERLDMNFRTDSVNPDEKSWMDLRLRHRIHVSYDLPHEPWKIFLNVELINTLNCPTAYLNKVTGKDYGQYLSDIRTQIGFTRRIDRRSSLTLSYRLHYGIERDVDITHGAGHIKLWNEQTFTHILSIQYELDW